MGSPIKSVGDDSEFQSLIKMEFSIQNELFVLKETDGPTTKIKELNDTIKSSLDELHVSIKKLKHQAQELDSEKEKEYRLSKLKRHEVEYDSLRETLRKANLTCKKNMEKREEKERELLFQGGEDAMKLWKERAQQDMVKASRSITEALHRSRHTMSEQLQRSLSTIQEIDESSKIIDQTVHQHKTYSSTVRTARGMLNKLKQRDLTDRLLVLFGLVVFFLVVLYVVKVRLRFKIFSFLYSFVAGNGEQPQQLQPQ